MPAQPSPHPPSGTGLFFAMLGAGVFSAAVLMPLALVLGVPAAALAPLAALAAAVSSIGAVLFGLLSLALAPLMFIAVLALIVRNLDRAAILSFLRQLFPGLMSFAGQALHAGGTAVSSVGEIGVGLVAHNSAVKELTDDIKNSNLLKDDFWTALSAIPGADEVGDQVRTALQSALASLDAAETTLTTAIGGLDASGRNLQNMGADLDPTLPRPP